jgi:hypothetical protein
MFDPHQRVGSGHPEMCAPPSGDNSDPDLRRDVDRLIHRAPTHHEAEAVISID